MRLSTKISLLVLGCLLAYSVCMEIADHPPEIKAPPGVTVASFADLGKFSLPDSLDQLHPGDLTKLLPKSILDLDSKKVLIQGFMIPTREENNQIKEFLLIRSQANCCYGVPLQFSDVAVVRATDRPFAPMMDQVITVVGLLHVQETWSGQHLGFIYQIDAESVVPSFRFSPVGSNRGDALSRVAVE